MAKNISVNTLYERWVPDIKSSAPMLGGVNCSTLTIYNNYLVVIHKQKSLVFISWRQGLFLSTGSGVECCYIKKYYDFSRILERLRFWCETSIASGQIDCWCSAIFSRYVIVCSMNVCSKYYVCSDMYVSSRIHLIKCGDPWWLIFF